MGVGAGLYMYVVVVQKFTFAISSPDEFLSYRPDALPAGCRPTDSVKTRVISTKFSQNLVLQNFANAE